MLRFGASARERILGDARLEQIMFGNGSAIALISSAAGLDADADSTPCVLGVNACPLPRRTGRLSSQATRMILKTAKRGTYAG